MRVQRILEAVEQDRDADTRTNSVYLRTAYVVALVDATKIVKLSK